MRNCEGSALRWSISSRKRNSEVCAATGQSRLDRPEGLSTTLLMTPITHHNKMHTSYYSHNTILLTELKVTRKVLGWNRGVGAHSEFQYARKHRVSTGSMQ